MCSGVPKISFLWYKFNSDYTVYLPGWKLSHLLPFDVQCMAISVGFEGRNPFIPPLVRPWSRVTDSAVYPTTGSTAYERQTGEHLVYEASVSD